MEYFPDKIDLEDAGMRGGSRLFLLMARFRYLSSYGMIEAPAGMISDGASIPRIFWNILDPFGDYFGPALIHDYLYSPANTEFTRREADDILKEAMFNIGIPWYRRETIYRAVRLCGASSFRGTNKN